jgi:hypothetical protein
MNIMEVNRYVPNGLPLLTDVSLLKTLRHYKELQAVLSGCAFPSITGQQQQIEAAIVAIEEELKGRGAVSWNWQTEVR